LECLGGVKVESRETGACSVVGIVPKTGFGIAVDAGGWGDSGIKTSVSGAAGDAASGIGVIGLEVL
jgi:hypothetical protein